MNRAWSRKASGQLGHMLPSAVVALLVGSWLAACRSDEGDTVKSTDGNDTAAAADAAETPADTTVHERRGIEPDAADSGAVDVMSAAQDVIKTPEWPPFLCPTCPIPTAAKPAQVAADGAAVATVEAATGTAAAVVMRVRLPPQTTSAGCLVASTSSDLPLPRYALIAFADGASSTGQPPALSEKIAIRECATGLAPAVVSGTKLAFTLPDQLLVDALAVAPLPQQWTATLSVRVHLASDALASGDATTLPAALTVAAAAFTSLNVKLDFTVVADRLGPQAALQVSPAADALDSLFDGIGEAPGEQRLGVPVLLVGCLRHQNKALETSQQLGGWTTRIPGGLAPSGAADGALVATGHCTGNLPVSSTRLGWRIAHELGHWLGLQHVVEIDGTEDSLPDTDPAAHNLMNREELKYPSFGLTPMQSAVIRRHPAVAHPGPAPKRNP